MDQSLLSDFYLGSLRLPNRVVMAPMTRNRAGERNIPTALNMRYYVQRAGAGLIVTEGSQISPQGVGYPATPGIHSAEQVAGWSRVTEAVQRAGGRIFLQLWHVGRVSHPSLQPGAALPVAPSAIRPAGEAVTYEGLQPFVTPRALEMGELAGIVDDYRQAAENAKAAGFDGVEIHAANGYLLDQFLRDGSNHRTDDYGGSIPNRCRLLLQVIDAVTGVWGSDRVGVRISPLNPFNDMADSDPNGLFGYVALELGTLGLAYLHVLEGALRSDQPLPAFDYEGLKRTYGGTYMTNGGYTLERGNRAIQEGLADLVSFGVPFIANPDLPRRFALGAGLNVADEATFYGGNAHGYTDYLSLKEAGAEA